MENSKTKNKSYKRFLTGKNKFDGTLNLSDELVQSFDVLLPIILKQTNLKNQISVNKYFNENFKDAAESLNNSFYEKNEGLDSIFGFELFEKYLSSIKNQFHSQQYNPILSNKKQIEYLLDELTEIFYTKGNSFNGLEHIWIVFIQSLQDCMDKLEKDQKYPFLSPKKHYIDVKERSVPNNWGWFEFHIRNFANSFTNTLIECLNSETKLIAKHQDLASIYCYTKEILNRKRFADEGNKTSKGFSTVGEYINPKIDSLAYAVNFYEKNRIDNTKFIFNDTTIIHNEITVNQDIKYNTYDTTINFKNEFNSFVYENLKQEPKTVTHEDEQKKQSNSDAFKDHSLIEKSGDDLMLTEDENIETKFVLTEYEPHVETFTDNDFIDLIIGKNRKSKEVKFDMLMKKLPKGSITIENNKYKWNIEFFIETYGVAKNKPQNYLYAFWGVCLNEYFISLSELSPTESIRIKQIENRIRLTFQLEKDFKISNRRFKEYEYIQMEKMKIDYLKPFEGLISKKKMKKS